MAEYIKYGGAIIVLAIIQKTLIWLLAVTEYRITPDIVLIGVVYLGIREGKIAGSVGGFIAGLLIDLFSFSFLGLTALAKCVAGFFSGYFNAQGKIDRNTTTYTFVFIVFFASLMNNLLYYYIYFQGSMLGMSDLILRYILPTALYTSFLSFLPIIIFNRKRRIA